MYRKILVNMMLLLLFCVFISCCSSEFANLPIGAVHNNNVLLGDGGGGGVGAGRVDKQTDLTFFCKYS